MSSFFLLDYMKRLIAVSQQDLNGMFLTTYGEMYRENDALFMDLFTSLRNYYFGIEIDLEQVMDDFFFVLFQKMFALLNVDYEYTSSFWMCTGNYMEELMPFENIPQKLTLQIRRSLTAARTFVQGLGIGRDVVTDISKVGRTICVEPRGYGASCVPEKFSCEVRKAHDSKMSYLLVMFFLRVILDK